MASRSIRIHHTDNVATALEALPAGADVDPAHDSSRTPVILIDPIDFGHKFAIREIPAGEAVVKYGASIGRASRHIRAGEHVHVHNTESNRGRGDLPAAAAPAEDGGGEP